MSRSDDSSDAVAAHIRAAAAYHDELGEATDPARRAGWRSRAHQALRFEVCCSALDVEQLDSVLDVGCGEGDLLPALRRRGFRGRYVGVDVLSSMIEMARARHTDSRARFLVGDLLETEPIDEAPCDLVVACGTLSLDVPSWHAHCRRMLAAMWEMTRGALVVVVPSARARRHLVADDALVYVTPASLHRLIDALPGSHVALREDYLPIDIAGIAYRDRSPAHEGLLEHGDVSPEEVAWLYLERGSPGAALAVLDEHGDPETAVYWLRRGQAERRLGRRDDARRSLSRALELDPECTEAQLELNGC